MSDIQYIMLGFESEMQKQSGMVGDIGRRVYQGVKSGLQHPVTALRGAKDVIGGGLKEPMASVGRSGQRQLHALTGWTPKGFLNPEGARGMRAGAYDAVERLDKAKAAVKPGAEAAKPGRIDKLLRRSPEEVQTRSRIAKDKELVSAGQHHDLAVKAEKMGLTSLPGYAKSLKEHGVGETVGTGLKEQWHSFGPAGKAFMVGMPAVGVGGELARKSEPGEPGRLARAGQRVGDLAYTMAPLPFAGQIAAGMGIGEATGAAGGLLDRFGKKNPTKHVPAPPTLEPAGGEAVPGERVITDRALNTGGF